MADYTPEQLERMIASMRESAGTMARAATSMESSSKGGGRDGAASRLRADLRGRTNNFNHAVDNFSNNLRDATGNVESFGRWFDRFVRSGVGMLFGGAITSQIVQSVKTLNDTYRELNEVGQTFSGSMFEMARQAGEASLSLDQFSQLITKFSNAAAVLGRQVPGGLPMLSHAVRSSARQVNMYGYSVEQLNEITGEYAETMRLQGQGFDISTASQQILAMAENAAAFSNMTGRARSEINRQANESLRDVMVTSRTQSQITDQQRSALNSTTAFLASIPGDAGRVMSQFFTQAFGAGTALYTEQSQRFSEAGFGQAISIMDRLRARVEAGDDGDEAKAEFTEEFVRQVDAANEGLRLQALAGNAAAREVLKMRDEMRAMSQMSAAERAKAREDAKVRAGLTSFVQRFSQMFNEVMGAFREGFWEQIKDLDQALSGFLAPGGGVEALRRNFTRMGETIGRFVTRVLTPENIARMGSALERLTNTISEVIGTMFGGTTGSSIGDTLGLMFRGLVMVTEALVRLFTGLGRFANWLDGRPFGQQQAPQGGDQNRAWYDKTTGEWAVMIASIVAAGYAVTKVFKLISYLAGGAMAAYRFLSRGGRPAGINPGAGAAGLADDGIRAGAGAAGAAANAARGGAVAAGVAGAAGAATAADDAGRLTSAVATPAVASAADETARLAAAVATPAAGAADEAARLASAVATPTASLADEATRLAASAGGATAAATASSASGAGGLRPPGPAPAGMFWKLLPGVGFVLSTLDAGARLGQGDYTGAAISMAAGAASFLPVGGAASLGLTGVNMARDMSRANGPVQGPGPEEQALALEAEQRTVAAQIERNRAMAEQRRSRGRDASEHLQRIEQLMEQQLQLSVAQNRIHNSSQRDQQRILSDIGTSGSP